MNGAQLLKAFKYFAKIQWSKRRRRINKDTIVMINENNLRTCWR